ncbi:MAG: cobalamin-dependent protein [Pseudomonadota bacterium]
MSLMGLIARKSRSDATAFSLPHVFAERALSELSGREGGRINPFLVQKFCDHLVTGDGGAADAYVDTLRELGLGTERLLTGYIPAAADALGIGWVEDRITFSQVTAAMGALMAVTRQVMPPPRSPAGRRPPRILLSRAPGEEHVLGLLLASHALRQQGWLVNMDLSGDLYHLRAKVLAEDVDIVGFGITCPERLNGLQAAIKVVRNSSKVRIVVGGGLVAAADDKFGADLAIPRHADIAMTLSEEFGLELIPTAATGDP